MSRFKPSSSKPAALSPFPYESSATEVVTAAVVPANVENTLVPAEFAGRGGSINTLGFFLVCLSMIAGYVNEWTMRLVGGKSYVSTVLVLLLPAIWLISGDRFRGLHHNIGRWWVGFLFCLLVDTPFSAWRTGTLTLLTNYIPRSYLMFFILTAFASDLRRCRVMVYLSAATSAMLLLTCFKYGISDGERLRIPDSAFFANSNDLALGLVLGIVEFAFLFFQKGIIKRVFAIIGITISVVYVLRTGSRGCTLALLAYSAMIFVISKQKALVVVLALAAGLIGIVVLPSSTLVRLMTLSVDQNDANSSALGSTLQRKELFKRSIEETLKHPVFGVGPGQFAVAVAGEAEKKGENSEWLGTHNSYTQVSAECGIPAFICYCAVIFICFRMNYRLYRVTRDKPAYNDVAALSFTMLSAIFIYSFATFFFHMAYTGSLPWISGMTVAIYFASKPLIRRDLDPSFK